VQQVLGDAFCIAFDFFAFLFICVVLALMSFVINSILIIFYSQY